MKMLNSNFSDHIKKCLWGKQKSLMKSEIKNNNSQFIIIIILRLNLTLKSEIPKALFHKDCCCLNAFNEVTEKIKVLK